jgi:hypothetical protein
MGPSNPKRHLIDAWLGSMAMMLNGEVKRSVLENDPATWGYRRLLELAANTPGVVGNRPICAGW